MFAVKSFLVLVGVFCLSEALSSNLLYERFFKNTDQGKMFYEIYYNGIKPPICNNTVCPIMDDAELTEYLKKSVLEGSAVSEAPVIVSQEIPTTTAEPVSTTTESLFTSNEENNGDEYTEPEGEESSYQE
uniref:Uncharacterized protein n=1 Tax=Megaselia scalaris TaxID=36166 RepID=T1GQT3_MEGSC